MAFFEPVFSQTKIWNPTSARTRNEPPHWNKSLFKSLSQWARHFPHSVLPDKSPSLHAVAIFARQYLTREWCCSISCPWLWIKRTWDRDWIGRRWWFSMLFRFGRISIRRGTFVIGWGWFWNSRKGTCLVLRRYFMPSFYSLNLSKKLISY